MTTDVGHGRRGRRAGAKRRAPRAAIAAGALAAASIPLWPSPAGAGNGFFDEFKRETHMENGCPITVESWRLGGHLSASTRFGSGSACLALLEGVRFLRITVSYVNVGSDTVRSSTANGAPRSDGAYLSMTNENGVRDLVESNHYHGDLDVGPVSYYTLEHPK